MDFFSEHQNLSSAAAPMKWEKRD